MFRIVFRLNFFFFVVVIAYRYKLILFRFQAFCSLVEPLRAFRFSASSILTPSLTLVFFRLQLGSTNVDRGLSTRRFLSGLLLSPSRLTKPPSVRHARPVQSDHFDLRKCLQIECIVQVRVHFLRSYSPVFSVSLWFFFANGFRFGEHQLMLVVPCVVDHVSYRYTPVRFILSISRKEFRRGHSTWLRAVPRNGTKINCYILSSHRLSTDNSDQSMEPKVCWFFFFFFT